MACSVCDHTMQNVGPSRWWCPRCGALKETRGESQEVTIHPKALSLTMELGTAVRRVLDWRDGDGDDVVVCINSSYGEQVALEEDWDHMEYALNKTKQLEKKEQ